MDLHISVIADFKNIFPNIEIVHWCLSGHAWVFNRSTDIPKHINPHTWINMNEDMILAFQQEYDGFLKTFDGFICGHPNGFALLFEKYNKPIIMINSCRYDLPFCISRDHYMLKLYKECLQRLQTNGLLIAVSNNKVDQLYTKLGCNIDTIHIPSLCEYTGIKYQPTRPTFLCYHGHFPKHPLITYKYELGQPFQWTDISQFKGIIHVPYEISTMSMFEHYTGGMPLFFPSKRYVLENVNITTVSSYWNQYLPEELSLFLNLSNYIDLADFYQVFTSPNVYLYDSFEHLIELLERFEWKDDSQILMEYKQNIKNGWSRILNIKPHKKIVLCIFGCITIEKYRNQIQKIKETYEKYDENVQFLYFLGEKWEGYHEENFIYLDNVGDDYMSASYKEEYGLKYIYENYNPDFVLCCGTDTFINIPKLVSFLEKYDKGNSLFIGGHGCYRTVFNKSYYYHSGGPGIILSNECLKKIYPFLGNLTTKWREICEESNIHELLPACDVALSYFLQNYIDVDIVKTNDLSMIHCNHRGYPCHQGQVDIQNIITCHLMSPEDFDEYNQILISNNYFMTM